MFVKSLWILEWKVCRCLFVFAGDPWILVFWLPVNYVLVITKHPEDGPGMAQMVKNTQDVKKNAF